MSRSPISMIAIAFAPFCSRPRARRRALPELRSWEFFEAHTVVGGNINLKVPVSELAADSDGAFRSLVRFTASVEATEQRGNLDPTPGHEAQAASSAKSHPGVAPPWWTPSNSGSPQLLQDALLGC